jgi:hypothetical protein
MHYKSKMLLYLIISRNFLLNSQHLRILIHSLFRHILGSQGKILLLENSNNRVQLVKEIELSINY